MKIKLWSSLLFVYVFCLVGLRVQNISMYDTQIGRPTKSGDAYSDRNAHSAIQYFYDFGFWDSHFRPMHGYQHGGDKSNAQAYTHYPALPDVIGGAYARILGTTAEIPLRTLPVIASMLLFVVIFLSLRTWLGSEGLALGSTAVLVLSNYFISWSDNLHKHTWEQFFTWIFVFVLWQYYQGRIRALWTYLFLSLLALVASNISLEQIPYIAVMVCGLSITFRSGYRKIFDPLNVVLGAAFVAGILIHFWLNVQYFGSLERAIQDVTGALSHRTGTCLDANLCGMTLAEKISLPLDAINRIEKFFLIPGFAILYFAFLCGRKWKRERPELFGLLCTVLVASFIWYLVLPQHGKVHQFIARHAGILVGLAAAPGAVLALDQFSDAIRLRRYWQIALLAIFALYILGMAITQQVVLYHWQQGWRLIL